MQVQIYRYEIADAIAPSRTSQASPCHRGMNLVRITRPSKLPIDKAGKLLKYQHG